MRKFIYIYTLLIVNILFSQSDVPLTLKTQFNGSYGYKVIGNTHNFLDNRQTPTPPCIMNTTTSATLNLTPNQNIVAAYLYWSGIGDGTFDTVATLNGINYTAQNTFVGYPTSGALLSYFSSFCDITSQIINSGNGMYTFSNYNLNPITGYCTNRIYYSGWYIVLVYNDVSLPNTQLNVYDGFNVLSYYYNSGVTSLQIDNLNITDTNAVEMTYVAWNGSPNSFSSPAFSNVESVSVNSNLLSNAQNPVINPFNGTNSFTGSTTNWNMDVDTYNIGNYVNIADTTIDIVFTTMFFRFISTIITSIPSELPDATISLNSISGQDICDNRDLAVNFTVFNVNANDTLPAGTPISFFVNDSVLVSTVLTPSQILIGGSLNLNATISIPSGISSPFTVKFIANQDSTELGVIPESNLTNNVSNDTLISLNEIFIPTFDSIAPVCQGTNVVLPTTSTNGVVGTWSPAFNNQVTTTYLFIPADTNCVDSVQLTVQIVPSTLPTFSLADSICANGTLVFPTVSNNVFTGMWSAAFDNQNSATYTFTPDSLNVPASACPISTQHAVVIVPQTVPSFSFADSMCIGASFVLPSPSDNGILGTWSAPFNNQMTTGYSFSPSAVSVFNGCAVPVTQTITIIPTLSPTFSIADSMCADVVFALPTSSNENVLGTWSPVFNNQATHNYVFTPNSFGIVNTNLGFRCPLSASKTVTIVPRTSLTFTILDSICVGANLVLPVISTNGYSGTWSPAFNNQVTTTYTFAPTSITVATGCPQTAQKTVLVDPFVDPIFTSIDSICQGNSISLSTLSENFINGNWSPIFNNQATTTYTFTPSDPGCIATTQMTVPVFPLITPSFSIADSICQNDTLVFPTVSDNSISGTWSPAFNSQQTTTYTFTPNVYECAVSVQWTVQVAPRILPTFSLPDTICQSEVIVLPLISDNGISGTWSPVFNNQQTTNYTFIRNTNECASNTSANITVMPTSISFDTIIFCENDLPFNWFGQILTSSTNTSVTLQDQYGCDSVVKLSFQVLPIQYSSFSATICSNDPAFQWAGQSYNQTGSYNQTFTAQNGCDSVVSFNLLVNPAPNVDFSVLNWSGCLPAEISFVNNQVAPNTTYLWDFGNGKVGSGINGESSLYTQAGCFDVQLTATNEFGCVATQNQQNAVCFDPNPVASFSPQNNPLPLVNPVTLFDNNSTSAFTWLWDFGDGNLNTSLFSPLHTFPEKAGIYYVTLYIENENGCKDSSVQKIIIEQDPLFYVPNAFTPDNNEFNEVFLPVFSDNLVLSEFELRITNRWGELLFVSQNPTVGWDGTYGGKLVQDGVYVYNVVFREVGFASVFQSTGNVNLVR